MGGVDKGMGCMDITDASLNERDTDDVLGDGEAGFGDGSNAWDVEEWARERAREDNDDDALDGLDGDYEYADESDLRCDDDLCDGAQEA